MNTLKKASIMLIPTLFISFFFSACVPKSRHLKAVAEKDLLVMQLQNENDKNISLERAKKSLKERLSEMNRQSSLSEQDQHRKIVALEKLNASRNKEIESLKALLAKKKQNLTELKGLLAAESIRSGNISKDLLQERDARERKEQSLRKQLKIGEMRIASLEEGIAEKAKNASELQSQLSTELKNSESQKKKLDEIKRLSDLRKQKLDETARTSAALIEELRSEIDQGNVVISRMKDRLSVQIVNKVLFASGSNVVSKKGKEILKNVSRVLKSVKENTIRIEGHTDNVPISAGLSVRFPSNWELSTARATQVVRYLIDEQVDPKNLMAAGMSQFAPVAPNDSPEGRQMNRRIEIILAPKEKSS